MSSRSLTTLNVRPNPYLDVPCIRGWCWTSTSARRAPCRLARTGM